MQKPSNNNPYYFNFNALVHYQIKIDDAALEDLEFKKTPSHSDVLLSNILFKNHPPQNIKDIAFIESLNQLGFQKKEIAHKHFDTINELFKEQDSQNIEEPYCGAVYRDVLIFYKENKIIGIAKLCFSCGHFSIVGTKKDTSNFSTTGTLKKLQQLLHN